MNRKHILGYGVIAAVLLASNAWWFWLTLDQAVTDKYHDQMLYERKEALKSALRTLPTLAKGMPRDEVVARVARAVGDAEPYEKEGVVVVDWLVLRFNERGELVEASTAFSLEP